MICLVWAGYKAGQRTIRCASPYPNSVYELNSGGYVLVYDDGPVYFDTQRLKSCITADANDAVCPKQ